MMWVYMGMLFGTMLFNMLLGSGLVTMLGQVDMVLFLVSSMSLLVSVVAVGSNLLVLVLDLDEVVVNSGDLIIAIWESSLTISLMDETIKLVDLLHASTHDFLLLISLQFGLESSILLLHLLNLAGSFLIISLLNELLVVLMMLLGVLVTVFTFMLRINVNSGDFSTALNEVFFATRVHEAVVLVSICNAIFVLQLVLLHSSCLLLSILLHIRLGLLGFVCRLSFSFFLLFGQWFFLLSAVSRGSATVSVMLVASVFGQRLG